MRLVILVEKIKYSQTHTFTGDPLYLQQTCIYILFKVYSVTSKQSFVRSTTYSVSSQNHFRSCTNDLCRHKSRSATNISAKFITNKIKLLIYSLRQSFKRTPSQHHHLNLKYFYTSLFYQYKN